MSTARRPEPRRRRRQVSPVSKPPSVSKPPAPAASRPPGPAVVSRSGLTTRAAILGLVLCALVVSAALPFREFLSQQGEIDAATARQVEQRARVAALEQQLAQLKDPAYVKTQARLRLHFVLPGETAYVVISPAAPPPAQSKALVAGATATGPESPWYSQVWGSVKAADRPLRVSKSR